MINDNERAAIIAFLSASGFEDDLRPAIERISDHHLLKAVHLTQEKRDGIKKNLSYGSFLERVIPIIYDKYSMEEIRILTDFFNSEIGMKFRTRDQEIRDILVSVMSGWIENIELLIRMGPDRPNDPSPLNVNDFIDPNNIPDMGEIEEGTFYCSRCGHVLKKWV